MTTGVRIPASGFQAGLWFLSQAHPDVPLHTVPLVLRLRGTVDPTGVRLALHHVVDVHEILRLQFTGDADGLWLVPAPTLPEPVLHDLGAAADPERAWQDLVTAELARPVDLRAGVGHRSSIAILGDAGVGVLMLVHHAYADARSVEIMLADLRHAYATWERTGSLPPVRETVPYREITEHIAAGDVESSRDYWQDALAGVADYAPPADRQPPAHRGYTVDELEVPLPDGLIDHVDHACRTLRASRFMVLAAGFAAALHRWSPEADPVLAVPRTLRHAEWLDDVVAPLLNTMPLHLPVAETASFRELVGRTRSRTAAAMAHAGVAFEQIARGSGRAGGTPLTSVAFQVSARAPRFHQAGDVTVEVTDPGPPAGDMDLAWDVVTEPGRDLLSIRYAAELYEPDTVRRLADEYLAMVAAGISLPDKPLRAIEHRADEYVADLWAAGEMPLAGYEIDDVVTLFAQSVAADPDGPALACGERRWTYAELDARAAVLAGRLAAAGVRPGDVVALCLPDGVDCVTAMLAVPRCGAAYLPIHPDQPGARIRAVVHTTRPAAVVGDRLPAALAGLPSVPAGGLDDVPMPSVPVYRPDPLAVCCVLCTSGTTGEPKAVAVPHQGVVSLTYAPAFVAIGPGDAILQLAPLSFDAATFEVWTALLNGATLVLPERRKPTATEIGDLVRRHGITLLHLTAGLLRVVADGDLGWFAPLHTLLTGGDTISVPHVRRLMDQHPRLTVVGCYGPTENATFSSVEVSEAPPAGGVLPLGGPLPGRSMHVLDRMLRPVSPGRTGEVYVGGIGLAHGYVGDPRQTSVRFVAHPRVPGERLYRTGDLARLTSAGDVEFLGRADGQVKIRGHRVEPAEAESALARHPLVRGCLVRPRGAAGNRSLAAYVVPCGDVTTDELRAHLSGLLPEPLVPTEWWLLDAFPLTANGKVDFRALEALPTAVGETAVSPRTDTERAVSDIWCDTLGRAEIGVTTGFFAAGGHSLAALRIAGQAESRFGRPVPLAEVLRRPTIADFAAWLDETPAVVAETPKPRAAAPVADFALATDDELAAFRDLTGLDPTIRGAKR